MTEEPSWQKPRSLPQHLIQGTSKNPIGMQQVAFEKLNARNRIQMIVQEQVWQRKAQMRMRGGVGCRKENERRGEEREREIISERENMYISGVECSSFHRLGLAMALQWPYI